MDSGNNSSVALDPAAGNGTIPEDYTLREIPILIISILSTLSNLIIIYIIIKYRVLHKRTYIYIANWCVCNCLVTTSAPVLFDLLGTQSLLHSKVFCVWAKNSFVFMVGDLLFIAILIIDWYISVFCGQNKCTINCRRCYKCIIATVWTVLLTNYALTTASCFSDLQFSVPIIGYVFGYLGVFLLIVIILVLRLYKLKRSSTIVEKSRLELIIVLSYFLSWCPNLVYMIYCVVSRMRPTFIHITYAIGYNHSCILLFLLYTCDRSFEICFRSLFRMKIPDAEDDRHLEAQNTLLIVS